MPLGGWPRVWVIRGYGVEEEGQKRDLKIGIKNRN
jgi:hypothetical protein